MGAAVEQPLQSANPLIIDYANRFRSDQLDVYLVSRCDFMVSSGSGLDALTDLFRRPVVFVNHVTLEAVHCWLPNITILKRYRNRSTGSIMTFSEIVAADAGRIFDAREYENRGIELIDNSPAEIRDATYEMMARLNGSWQDAPGDVERQNRFWEILAGSPLQGPRHGRIGAHFLRDHSYLLG